MPSDIYNCNFEAINQVLNKRMKKLEMEYRPFICIIIFYLILCIRFRKEFLMLSLYQELLTFACDFFSSCSLQVHSNFFQLLKVVFKIMYTKCCLDHLFYTSSTFFFCNLKQVQIINETKLNYVTSKPQGGMIVSEIDKYIASFFVDDRVLKLSLLN